MNNKILSVWQRAFGILIPEPLSSGPETGSSSPSSSLGATNGLDHIGIGDPTPLLSTAALKARPPARYAVLGDIHANLEAFTAVLDDARAQGCARFVCVGDIVGYNTNPKECIELVRQLEMPCVKGNHDEYCSKDDFMPPPGVNARAVAAILWTREQLSEGERQWLKALKYVRPVGSFSIVHATLDDPKQWGYVVERVEAAASFSYQTTPVCFFGHTHLPMAFVRDGLVRHRRYSTLKVEPGRQYFVNVGSVGEPRDGDPRAAYVIYEPATGFIELRRVAYDVQQTLAKARAAGLPPRRTAM